MSIYKRLPVPAPLKNFVLSGLKSLRWTRGAWREALSDQFHGLGDDCGPQAAIDAGLLWLGVAQDNTASGDGGIARHYSPLTGWAASYPETTGYAIPTLLLHGSLRADAGLLDRARRALDWLLSIQMANGAFQGSTIGVTPVVAVTFDTGQILMGLAAGARTFGEPYTTSMGRAADWLTQTQSPDGAWRTPNPYVDTPEGTVRTFETHVAWGLLEASRVNPDTPWAEAGLKNIRWALTHQKPNGWFANCCLDYPEEPLTHTLAYALRGVIEGYRLVRDPALLEASLRTASGLAKCIDANGFLPGRLDSEWRPRSKWACLTGTAQTAICLMLLHQETQDSALRAAALRASRYVRRTLSLDGAPETRGGVKGSFPVSGKYGHFQYLNWACKFMIDANALELGLQ